MCMEKVLILALEQENLPEDDLPQLTGWPDITMLTCRRQRGDTCHSKRG
jgi:hypothetical protein